VLVRDLGDGWQLVRQPDHADLSGQLAAAWGGAVARPDPLEPVVLAATRHDDGWGVYDRRPTFDGTNERPTSFLDVPIPAHLAFYRACIEVVTQEDAYAGLLVSMHGAGIYNGRYGTQPGLRLSGADEYQEQVDAFVAEQEATHAGRAAEAGAADTDRWTNYKLLQVYDRLSLSLCLRDWETEAAERDTVAPAPVDYDGGEAELAIEPRGRWHVSIDPYPFTESPARFTVVRKVLPKRSHRDNAEFRREYFGTPSETVEITVEQA
jgi:hypothetical protein